MISTLTAFTRGLSRLWLHKRMLIWLYLVNLAFAGVLLAPFRRLVSKINKTDLADDFATGFQVDTFFVLWVQYSDEFKTLGISALGLAAMYLLVNIFLTGGIMGTLATKERASLRRFSHEAGRFFSRYVRLFVVMVVALCAVGAGYKYGLEPVIEAQRDRANTDVLSTLWLVGGVGLVAIAASLVLMVIDYARIITVSQDRRSVLAASAGALWFCLRRPIRTVSLFYLNLVLVAAFFVLYVGVAQQFNGATLASILGLFAVQQAFILARIGMRVSFFSSQWALYQSLAPRPNPVEQAPPTLRTITRPPRMTASPVQNKPPEPTEPITAPPQPMQDQSGTSAEQKQDAGSAPQTAEPRQPGNQ